MTEIRFYHLIHGRIERVLPVLLQRVIDRDKRAVVVCGTGERVEALDVALWTFADHSFLPHGTKADGHAADQPVWLTETVENPNGAAFLFLIDGQDVADVAVWEAIVLIFDGRDAAAVAMARQRWKRWKDEGYALTYWRQTEDGWQERG